MDIRKEQEKGMEKKIDYAREIRLYNGIKEWKKQPKSIKDQDGDEKQERRRKTNGDAHGL
jgi:hypothetical protein